MPKHDVVLRIMNNSVGLMMIKYLNGKKQQEVLFTDKRSSLQPMLPSEIKPHAPRDPWSRGLGPNSDCWPRVRFPRGLAHAAGTACSSAHTRSQMDVWEEQRWIYVAASATRMSQTTALDGQVTLYNCEPHWCPKADKPHPDNFTPWTSRTMDPSKF